MRFMRCSAAAMTGLLVGLCLVVGPAFAQAPEGDALVVLPDGRVGIGTATPQASLEVAGTIRALNGLALADQALAVSQVLDLRALGLVHRLDGSAAGQVIDITLPSAPRSRGGLLSFIAAPHASNQGQFRIVGAGPAETIDGRADLRLLHTNAVVLMSDGERWTALAKKLDTAWVSAGPAEAACAASDKPCVVLRNDDRLRSELRWRRHGEQIELHWRFQGSLGLQFPYGTGPGPGVPLLLRLPSFVATLGPAVDLRPGMPIGQVHLSNMSLAGQSLSHAFQPLAHQALADGPAAMTNFASDAWKPAGEWRDGASVTRLYLVDLSARATLAVEGW